MLRVLVLGFCVVLGAAVVRPACAGEPTAPQLADAVGFGTVATLAPLCGLRDDAWAADLRRAMVQAATGISAHDDAALRAAPGSDLAVSALSYAESEALEDFAAAPPAASCAPLAHDIALDRADAIVRAFRDQRAPGPGS